jgi:type VI secretion system protein VasI
VTLDTAILRRLGRKDSLYTTSCTFGAVLAVMLLPVNALASTESCIRVENDLDRLTCYDREAGRTPRKETMGPISGAWVVEKSTSKLTDQPTVVMTTRSVETIDCGWSRGQISLTIRCHENTTSMLFVTGCHMTSSEYNNYGDVTYRLDEEKARTVGMHESTNNRTLGLWRGGQSIPVIKSMFGKSQMVVRMTPFGESPFTANFDINGLETAITPLRQACHW